MATYKQITDATPKGYTGGYCEAFVEDCFGVQYKFASALISWRVQQSAGVSIAGEPPLGITVPIWFDGLSGWAAPYGHIAVRDDAGYVWSSTLDGYHQAPYYHPNIQDLINVYKRAGHTNISLLGWAKELGEKVIVEEVTETSPTPAVEDDSYRYVSAPQGVAVRVEPSSESSFAEGYTYLDKDVLVKMQGWCYGQKVAEENRWFVTKSGFYMWFGGFTEKEKTLPHLSQLDKTYETEAELTPAPVNPEVKTEGNLVAKLITPTEDYSFITRKEPVLACNLFPERKLLKDAMGNYLQAIMDANDWDVLVDAVAKTDRPNQSIKYIVIHNPSNGSLSQTISEFQRAVNKSAHMVVDDAEAVLLVDFDNTAFAIGDNAKNAETLNIEFVEGVSTDRIVNILAEVQKLYPEAEITTHRKLSQTLCPATLDDNNIEAIKKLVQDKNKKEEPTEEAPVELTDNEENKEEEKIVNTITEEEQKQIAEEVSELIDSNDFKPVISDNVKSIAYFATDLGGIFVTLGLTLASVFGFMDAQQALIVSTAIIGSLASIKQTFRISSKK